MIESDVATIDRIDYHFESKYVFTVITEIIAVSVVVIIGAYRLNLK